MNSLEQIFHIMSLRPWKKKIFASGKGFSLAPEKQLKIPSILYWFIDFFQNVENTLFNEESMIFFI